MTVSVAGMPGPCRRFAIVGAAIWLSCTVLCAQIVFPGAAGSDQEPQQRLPAVKGIEALFWRFGTVHWPPQTVAWQRLDDGTALAVCRAPVQVPDTGRVRFIGTPFATVIGIFLVDVSSGQPKLVLDVFRLPMFQGAGVRIEQLSQTSAVISLEDTSGMRQLDHRSYAFDLHAGAVISKVRNRALDVTRVLEFGGKLYATADDADLANFLIVVERPSPDLAAVSKVLDRIGGEPVPATTAAAVSGSCLVLTGEKGLELRLCDGVWTVAAPRPPAEEYGEESYAPIRTLPEQVIEDEGSDHLLTFGGPQGTVYRVVVSDKGSLRRNRFADSDPGIYVLADDGYCFYPLPRLDRAGVLRARGTPPAPGRDGSWKVNESIGPFQAVGDTVRFGIVFDDREGWSGVGGIGAFMRATNRYELLHPKALVPWSASAILVDGAGVWVGLGVMRGDWFAGGGLVHYDPATGDVQRFDVPGVVQALAKFGGQIVIGTTNALCTLSGSVVSCFHLGVDQAGSLTLSPLAGEFTCAFRDPQEATQPEPFTFLH